MTCKYSEKCWRCSYTKYLQLKKSYQVVDGKVLPPTRSELFLSGFASAEMASVAPSKNNTIKFGGLYAEVMPMPTQNQTWCPDLTGQGFTHCHEYKKQSAFEARVAEKRERNQYPNATGRAWISFDTRKRVSARDKYTCYYCFRNTSELKSRGIRCQIDHVIPLALGGSNDESNLCYSCAKCNHEKGSQVWTRGCKVRALAD